MLVIAALGASEATEHETLIGIRINDGGVSRLPLCQGERASHPLPQTSHSSHTSHTSRRDKTQAGTRNPYESSASHAYPVTAVLRQRSTSRLYDDFIRSSRRFSVPIRSSMRVRKSLKTGSPDS